jgi:hypothetical protein
MFMHLNDGWLATGLCLQSPTLQPVGDKGVWLNMKQQLPGLMCITLKNGCQFASVCVQAASAVSDLDMYLCPTVPLDTAGFANCYSSQDDNVSAVESGCCFAE